MVAIGLVVGAMLGVAIWYRVYGKKSLLGNGEAPQKDIMKLPKAHQRYITDNDLRKERKERIETLDKEIPEEVKAGWTEEEQAGGVSLGGDTVRVSRVMDGVTLTEV